jgi:hypothetical protein
MPEERIEPVKDGQSSEKTVEQFLTQAATEGEPTSTEVEQVEVKPEEKPAGIKPEVKPEETAEHWKKQYIELQSGLTPKLQKLAELEKAQANAPEKVAEPQKPSTIDELKEAIAFAEAGAKKYEGTEFGDDARAFQATATSLKIQLRNEIERESIRGIEEQFVKFSSKHENLPPKTYQELGAIMQEKNIDMSTAYEVWLGRDAGQKAEQKFKNSLESKELGNKAQVQTGSQIDTKPSEDAELDAYYNTIEGISKSGGLRIKQ